MRIISLEKSDWIDAKMKNADALIFYAL